jgi:hypothetical protein
MWDRPPRQHAVLKSQQDERCAKDKRFRRVAALRLEWAELAAVRGELPFIARSKVGGLTLVMKPSGSQITASTLVDD